MAWTFTGCFSVASMAGPASASEGRARSASEATTAAPAFVADAAFPACALGAEASFTSSAVSRSNSPFARRTYEAMSSQKVTNMVRPAATPTVSVDPPRRWPMRAGAKATTMTKP